MDQIKPERRRHKRIEVSKSILDNAEFSALNLSESGMQLSTFKEQRPGRTIEVKLSLEGRMLMLRAEIVWCQRAASVFESGYHVGVQFVGHSVSDQLALRDYVERHL